jgi:hypothetical protein
VTELVAPEHPVLTEFEFVRCQLLGPAVLAPLGSTGFSGCTFDSPGGSFSTLFWEIAPGTTQVVGAIALQDCTFTECKFSGIGIAGPASLKEQFLKDLGELT